MAKMITNNKNQRVKIVFFFKLLSFYILPKNLKAGI